MDLKIEIMKETQELLGHANSKTTEVYNHVRIKNFGKIKSPLDFLTIKKIFNMLKEIIKFKKSRNQVISRILKMAPAFRASFNV